MAKNTQTSRKKLAKNAQKKRSKPAKNSQHFLLYGFSTRVSSGVGILLRRIPAIKEHETETLLSFYITDSAEAISYGLLRMKMIAVPYFICGLMDVSTGALRGMGASLSPMVISVLGVCGIRIGWIATIFQMEQFHRIEVVFVSYPVSWLLTLGVHILCFLIVRRKVERKVSEPA